MAKQHQPLDTSVSIITPENIQFSYRLAGPFRRAGAFLLDSLILGLFVFILMILVAFMQMGGGGGMGFVLFFVFFVRWAYFIVLEAWRNGQTIGKKIVGIRVATTDGKPVSFMQAVVRNLLRDADLFPLVPLSFFNSDINQDMFLIPTGLLAVVVMTMSRQFQRLGDLVSGTMVIDAEASVTRPAIQLNEPGIEQIIHAIPQSFAVPRSMAQALAHYVGQRGWLSQPRREEISHHLGQPLCEQLGIRVQSYDLLLCALYRMAFFSEPTEQIVPMSQYLTQAGSLSTSTPFAQQGGIQ